MSGTLRRTRAVGGLHASDATAPPSTASDQTDRVQPARITEAETTTLLTASQLADRWQVPVRTIYAWAKRNAIPHYRAGRLLRFDPAAVENHFRRQGFANEVVPDDQRPGESAFALLAT